MTLFIKQYLQKRSLRKSQEALTYLNTNGGALKNYKEYQSSFDHVLAAVQDNGLALEFADTKLKNNPTIVTEAITRNKKAMQFVGEELLNDYAFLNYLIPLHADLFPYVSLERKADKEFLLDILSKQVWVYTYLDDVMKMDRDIGITAVKQNYRTFYKLPGNLRADKEIALETIASIRCEIGKTSPLLWMNAILECQKASSILKHMSSDLQNDMDIVSNILEMNGLALRFTNDSMKHNETCIRLAVTQNGQALQYVPDKYRCQLPIIYDALFQTKHCLKYVPNELQTNEAVLWLHKHTEHIPQHEWPIVKQALIEEPLLFLNLPDAVTELLSEMPDTYSLRASYVLAFNKKNLSADNKCDLPFII